MFITFCGNTPKKIFFSGSGANLGWGCVKGGGSNKGKFDRCSASPQTQVGPAELDPSLLARNPRAVRENLTAKNAMITVR